MNHLGHFIQNRHLFKISRYWIMFYPVETLYFVSTSLLKVLLIIILPCHYKTEKFIQRWIYSISTSKLFCFPFWSMSFIQTVWLLEKFRNCNMKTFDMNILVTLKTWIQRGITTQSTLHHFRNFIYIKLYPQ